MKEEQTISDNFNAVRAHEFMMKSGNLPTIESLSKIILSNANSGQRCIRLFDVVITFDVMNELLKRGFVLSKHTGPGGEDISIISWA